MKNDSSLIPLPSSLFPSAPATRHPSPAPGVLHVGPPQRLPLPGASSIFARSRDGRVIASPQLWGAYVLHARRPLVLRAALVPRVTLGTRASANRSQPGRIVRLWRHADARFVAVSPNGHWVATGSHGSSSEVKVWDAETGRLAKSLFAGPGQRVAFSPNGQWLAASGDSIRVWEVGSWRAGQRFEGAISQVSVAFSPDSKILAFETGSGVVRLVDPVTGEEYGRLEDPNEERSQLEFSLDGTHIVAVGDGQSIRVWDLRAIRQQLRREVSTGTCRLMSLPRTASPVCPCKWNYTWEARSSCFPLARTLACRVCWFH